MSVGIRVLVCGGRDLSGRDFLFQILDALHGERPIGLIIEGGARGADRLAAAWALTHNIKVNEFPADWGRYGRASGPIRNRQMLDDGKPDLVVAFPGGSGTSNMIGQAYRRGIQIVIIGQQPARDVPPGQSWAFTDHRPMSEVLAAESGQ